MGLLNRYQARLNREYQRLLKTIIELQTARGAAEAKLPKEPKTVADKPSACLCQSVGGECEQHIARRAPLTNVRYRVVTVGSGFCSGCQATSRSPPALRQSLCF
jgi:hypothetical protein